MTENIKENIRNYSPAEFVHNLNNKLCMYIGGGLKGSETICNNPIHENGPYCEYHDRVTHKPIRKIKRNGIKE